MVTSRIGIGSDVSLYKDPITYPLGEEYDTDYGEELINEKCFER